MNKNEKGFNLLELMIAMAIIGLLIGISVYSWQVIVRRGNETAAIGHIKRISTAQAHFASKKKGKFASEFEQLVDAKLLSREFSDSNPDVDGYKFSIEVDEEPPFSYRLFAEPVKADGAGATGDSKFYFDSESDSITYTEESRRAKKDDPIV